jgi:hypothetical protein
MKTLVDKITGVSRFIFNDNEEVTITSTSVVTPSFIVGDMDSSNAVIVNGVTPPEDWNHCKYIYSAGTWTNNPDWVEPQP